MKAVTANSQIDITGITEILGTGHIDIETNGAINISEKTGDLRAGLIRSLASDVTLKAPGAIVDALNDADSDITGVNITLTAETGGIGQVGNFLDIDSSNPDRGALNATAAQDIFIDETAGNLNLGRVVSTGGGLIPQLLARVSSLSLSNNSRSNVTLRTRSGSILDFNNDSLSNIDATNIDLEAVGGGIGTSNNDLDIDSSKLETGRLVAKVNGGAAANGNIYLTETDDALNVLTVESADGDVRLTVTGLTQLSQAMVRLRRAERQTT